MKLVTLQPVEGSQKSVVIKVGRTIIGRGPLLECADKKVSRNHAIIEVHESGDIYLTPTHVNPCFYLPNDSNAGFEVLKKDCPQLIHNGDSFSLIPNSFRYKVSISDVSDYENIESEKTIAATTTAAATSPAIAASKVKESSSTTSNSSLSGTSNKKDETLLNGGNKKDPKEGANHKMSSGDESPKDNGKPTPPVKNGLSPVRASSRRIDSKSSHDLTGLRDQHNKTHSPNTQNSTESNETPAKDSAAASSSKEKEGKSHESKKNPVADDSRSDKKAHSKETSSNSNNLLGTNLKDKSPLASKKLLSEKTAAKKDARKEKADPEKQKQLKNFDFDDDEDEPVVKPSGKKPAQKVQAKRASDKGSVPSPSVSSSPSTSKKKETPSRKRSPQPSLASPSGSRSTRTHRTLIQRISLDDFMASDEEWIATYASSDEERKKARKRLSKRKTAAEASSDEEDWSGKKTPSKKRPAKKARKSHSDDELANSDNVNEDEEVELKPKRSRGKTPVASRRPKKKSVVAEDSESSEKSEDEAKSADEEDDEPKAPPRKSQAPKKKEAPKTPPAVPLPPKKKVFRRKKSHLYAESEEDFQRQLARAIRESKKEQMEKESEKREKATGYRATDHSAFSSTAS